ncbi:MAG: hypothetical protein OQK12_16815 [Motiliproteus sp.]|nr:hypothetical protein [Motiliproteus sp.]MCW9051252.1 hypothetical protein [Motiliproteus sp.]
MQSVTSIATSAKFQPDGSLQLVFDIEPDETTAAMQAMELAKNFALTPIEPPYGEQARQLKLSGFFGLKAVRKAVGTDVQYQAWVRKQKCAVTGGFDWDGTKGESRCTYCHVRRSVDSGTGIKPEYSGVPMVDKLHQLQHQHGELGALVHSLPQINTESQARAWFDKQAESHVRAWCWDVLKRQLGFGHWSEMPPRVLRNWAAQHALVRYLPQCYRDEQEKQS